MGMVLGTGFTPSPTHPLTHPINHCGAFVVEADGEIDAWSMEESTDGWGNRIHPSEHHGSSTHPPSTTSPFLISIHSLNPIHPFTDPFTHPPTQSIDHCGAFIHSFIDPLIQPSHQASTNPNSALQLDACIT
jgi:hypothetical protein